MRTGSLPGLSTSLPALEKNNGMSSPYDSDFPSVDERIVFIEAENRDVARDRLSMILPALWGVPLSRDWPCSADELACGVRCRFVAG